MYISGVTSKMFLLALKVDFYRKKQTRSWLEAVRKVDLEANRTKFGLRRDCHNEVDNLIDNLKGQGRVYPESVRVAHDNFAGVFFGEFLGMNKKPI